MLLTVPFVLVGIFRYQLPGGSGHHAHPGGLVGDDSGDRRDQPRKLMGRR
jgi:hypothetical protein